jgi:hypothetical protein
MNRVIDRCALRAETAQCSKLGLLNPGLTEPWSATITRERLNYMTFKNGMRPVHPGEILREEYLKPLDLSANGLAKALRLSPSRIGDISGSLK